MKNLTMTVIVALTLIAACASTAHAGIMFSDRAATCDGVMFSDGSLPIARTGLMAAD